VAKLGGERAGAALRSSLFQPGPPPQKWRRRKRIMSKKSNRINVPEAREAMDKFKMEAANDLRVPAPS